MSHQTGFTTALLLLVVAIAGYAIWNRSVSPSPDQALQQWEGEGLEPGSLKLVKFGAPWCPPCRAIDAELDLLKLSHGSVVDVVKVNVDDEPELANQYEVNGIPRLFLIRNDEVVGDKLGFFTHDELATWIQETAAAEKEPVAAEK